MKKAEFIKRVWVANMRLAVDGELMDIVSINTAEHTVTVLNSDSEPILIPCEAINEQDIHHE